MTLHPLKCIIITHGHEDHYKGIPDLLNNYRTTAPNEIEKLFINPDQQMFKSRTKESRSTWLKILEWGNRNKKKLTTLTAEEDKLSSLSGSLVKAISVLHPHTTDFGGATLNNTSVVLKISGTKTSALLTGDIEEPGWESLEKQLVSFLDIQADIIKFPHHGTWKVEEVDSLFDKVKPSFVVISVGSDNKYKHPDLHLLEAIAKREKMNVLCTQATNNCCNNAASNREAVVEEYKKTNKNFFFRNGTPCAGTIIVELGEQLKIISPDLEFHRNKIINRYHTLHKCNPKIASAVEKTPDQNTVEV